MYDRRRENPIRWEDVNSSKKKRGGVQNKKKVEGKIAEKPGIGSLVKRSKNGA